MAAGIERGPTWSEQHRHECEVRFVASLPTRHQRRRYFEGWTNEQGRRIKPLAETRGEAAAARLRADVEAVFRARRGAPIPQQDGVGRAIGGSVSTTGEQAGLPGSGSFLGPWAEGSSNPVECVESGAAAR